MKEVIRSKLLKIQIGWLHFWRNGKQQIEMKRLAIGWGECPCKRKSEGRGACEFGPSIYLFWQNVLGWLRLIWGSACVQERMNGKIYPFSLHVALFFLFFFIELSHFNLPLNDFSWCCEEVWGTSPAAILPPSKRERERESEVLRVVLFAFLNAGSVAGSRGFESEWGNINSRSLTDLVHQM